MISQNNRDDQCHRFHVNLDQFDDSESQSKTKMCVLIIIIYNNNENCRSLLSLVGVLYK